MSSVSLFQDIYFFLTFYVLSPNISTWTCWNSTLNICLFYYCKCSLSFIDDNQPIYVWTQCANLPLISHVMSFHVTCEWIVTQPLGIQPTRRDSQALTKILQQLQRCRFKTHSVLWPPWSVAQVKRKSPCGDQLSITLLSLSI